MILPDYSFFSKQKFAAMLHYTSQISVCSVRLDTNYWQQFVDQTSRLKKQIHHFSKNILIRINPQVDHIAHPAHLFRLPLVWSAGGSHRMVCYSILYDVRDYVHVSSNPFNNALLQNIDPYLSSQYPRNIWLYFRLCFVFLKSSQKGFMSTKRFFLRSVDTT